MVNSNELVRVSSRVRGTPDVTIWRSLIKP